jgi:D-sedoheptulose 7-phosphate isomerase
MEHLKSYMGELQSVLAGIDLAAVKRVRDACEDVFTRGGRIFACGNGGSAATASHFVNDLGKGASYGREKRFKVIALTDCIPWMTALANDVSYDAVFSEQLENLGEAGDLLIAISGSGNSPNVLRAVEVAQARGMQTAGLTGFGGGKLAPMVDFPVVADSHHMGRVEDVHMIVVHLICYYFMEQGDQ